MTLPRKPRAVVFDMDGLLFNTEALYRDAIIGVGRAMGQEIPHAFILSTIGLTSDATRAVYFSQYGEGFDFDGFWTRVSARFHELAESELRLQSGVRELLEALDEAEVPRAIATSSSHRTVGRHLAAEGLVERFPVVVARGDYARGKPSPDPFQKAAELLGVAPGDCLALEDSYNGVRAAAAAGMMTVMVPDLLEPTEEIRGLCAWVAGDLHEVRRVVFPEGG